MKHKLILAAVFLLLAANSSLGQTAADLTAKYGEPVRAYEVSEHIWMSPEFNVDGQVCQMRLYPKRFAAGDNNYLSQRLPFEELKVVLNRLAPPKTRGAKKDSFGLTATGGGAAWTTYPYEKITFIFISSFKIDSTTLKLKPYVFSEKALSGAKEKPAENLNAGDDDFLDSQSFSTEIVTIKWTDRKCEGNSQKPGNPD